MKSERSPFVVNFNYSWQALQGLQALSSVKTLHSRDNFKLIVALKKVWNLSMENSHKLIQQQVGKVAKSLQHGYDIGLAWGSLETGTQSKRQNQGILHRLLFHLLKSRH